MDTIHRESVRIPTSGCTEGEALDALRLRAQHDLDPGSGRMWGYVYDAGPAVHRVGARAFDLYRHKSALDPTVYPSAATLENEVVGMMAHHLGLPSAAGSFTSGGTESILLAVKSARERARQRGEANPRVVVAESAHPAFDKAALYLGLDVVRTPIHPETLRMDVGGVRSALEEGGVAMVVGSASTYGHGVVDPIEEIAALAQARDVLCHVDACVGGVMLPLFRELGDPVPPFDFGVPGVTSISVDLHKFGFCPRGSSVLLHRDRSLRAHQLFSHADWTGYTFTNMTVQSSRSVGPLAGSWAVLQMLGRDGYRRIAKELRNGRNRLIAGIRDIPDLIVPGDPLMCTFSFAVAPNAGTSVFEVGRLLRERDWYVQPQLGLGPSPPALHLTLNPSNLPFIDDFLRDLRECVADAPERDGNGSALLEAALATHFVGRATEEGARHLVTALGQEALTQGRSGSAVHDVLNELTPSQREALLVAYHNEILF